MRNENESTKNADVAVGPVAGVNHYVILSDMIQLSESLLRALDVLDRGLARQLMNEIFKLSVDFPRNVIIQERRGEVNVIYFNSIYRTVGACIRFLSVHEGDEEVLGNSSGETTNDAILLSQLTRTRKEEGGGGGEEEEEELITNQSGMHQGAPELLKLEGGEKEQEEEAHVRNAARVIIPPQREKGLLKLSLDNKSEKGSFMSSGSRENHPKTLGSSRIAPFANLPLDEIVMCLETIRNLCRTKSVHVRERVLHKFGRRLVHILEVWSERRSENSVLLACFSIFINLCHHLPKNCRYIVHDLNCENTLVGALDASIHDPKAVVFALRFIYILICENEFNPQYQFIAAGLGESVLSTMRAHPGTPELLAAGCHVLSLLPVDSAVRASLLKNGVADCILSAIHSHVEDERSQVAGLVAILSLLGYSSDASESALNSPNQAGNTSTSMSVSSPNYHGSFPPVESLVETSTLLDTPVDGSKTIELSSSHHVAHNSLGFPSIATSRAVLTSMRAHRSSAKIQEYSCRILGILAFNSVKIPQKLNERIRPLFEEISEAVSIAMNDFIGNSAVCSYGCGVMCNLAFHLNFNEEHGKLIIKCMENHKSEASVVEYGCRAIESICLKISNFDMLQFISLGACKAIVSALKLHSLNSSVQEYAIGAVAEMAKTSDFDVSLMLASEHNFVTLVMNAALQHLYSVAICYQTLRALGRLPVIGNIKCLELALSISSEHKRIMNIQLLIFSLIRNISRGNTEFCLKMGVHICIFEAITYHRSSSKLAEAGCSTLIHLGNRDSRLFWIMYKAGALDLVHQILARFSSASPSPVPSAEKLRKNLVSASRSCLPLRYCIRLSNE